MPTLYIMRHGETVWNREHRMQGWSDSELTTNGVESAKRMQGRLARLSLDAIYSSPSLRTRTTAQIVRGDHLGPVQYDERIKEMNMGEWEGQTQAEINEKYPEQSFAFWNTPHTFTTVHGELFEDVRTRVALFLEAIKHVSGNILIVTHAIVIKTLLQMAKGNSLEQFWNPPFIHHSTMTYFELNEQLEYIGVVNND
ncbi:histidine phosphatase family protein [Geomicrobium sp. JSM 1781026]|uniref:histidine phosphatase family protein n=1 Tax=Geomicrobium sp. JSM 1781026 TaxID=3344580 RepID=UPI0035BF5A5C